MTFRSVTLMTAVLALALLAASTLMSGCGLWSNKPTPPAPDPSADELREKKAELAKAGAKIAALQGEIDSARKIVATAGAGVHGVQVATDLVADEATKQAMKSEADLAQASLERVAPADPGASAAAELRIGRVVSQELDRTKAQLASVSDDLARTKHELAQQSAKVASQAAQLEQQAQHLRDQETARAAKDKEIDAWKEKWRAEREGRTTAERKSAEDRAAAAQAALAATRPWWGIIVAGLGLAVITAGLFAFALTHGEALASGTFAVFAGALVVAWGLKFEALWQSKAFPYAAGFATAAAIAALGWCLYFFWQTHQLYRKLTAALQDAKDEAIVAGTDLWNELREHLKYRLGDGRSYWSLTLKQRLISRGLRAEGPTPARVTKS